MTGKFRVIALAVAALSIVSASPAPALMAQAAPPVAKPTIVVPVDPITRAKFPKTNPELVDAIAYVNRLVNQMIQPVSDFEHYGVIENWVMFPEDMKGDCEDYALSKMEILRQAGFPTVQFSRIRGVVVHRAGKPDEGHAILELRMPDGAIMFLDNLHANPMTRAELTAQGYEFFDW